MFREPIMTRYYTRPWIPGAEFWKRYYEHLASDRWADLRRRVLARCKGTCEGCGLRPAVQVHHLNYDRLGDELLFDLVGVCLECHGKCHPDQNT
jgi:5-methylcytosine-specific restriction endonuclease McrA